MTIIEICDLLDLDPDEEGECVRCHRPFYCEPEFERVAICWPCATDLLYSLRDTLRAVAQKAPKHGAR